MSDHAAGVGLSDSGAAPRSPLDTDLTVGLTTGEAKRRLAESGPNALPEPQRPPWWSRLLRQFQSALIYLLLLALAVDLLTWLIGGALAAP